MYLKLQAEFTLQFSEVLWSSAILWKYTLLSQSVFSHRTHNKVIIQNQWYVYTQISRHDFY